MKGTIPTYPPRRLPMFSGNPHRSIYDPRFHDQQVESVNAIKNLRVIQGARPGLLVGRNFMTLVVPYSTPGAAAAKLKLPWQITLVRPGVIKVSAGFVFVTNTLIVPSAVTVDKYEPVGTDTEIILADADTYYIWAKVYYDAPDFKAEVQTGTIADIPTNWYQFPSPHNMDTSWPVGGALSPGLNDEGYILLGQVDNTGAPNPITQFVFDNPTLVDYNDDAKVTWGGTWNGGGLYRNGTQVIYSGHLYVRVGLTIGDNGGTPGGFPTDWVLIL